MTGWVADTEVQLRVSGEDASGETAELWDWLRDERALAGAVHAARTSPGDGELGGAIDMLAVALGSGGAGAALAGSLTAWLRTRRPGVTITVTTPKKTIAVQARNVDRDDVHRLLETVLRNGDV